MFICIKYVAQIEKKIDEQTLFEICNTNYVFNQANRSDQTFKKVRPNLK